MCICNKNEIGIFSCLHTDVHIYSNNICLYMFKWFCKHKYKQESFEECQLIMNLYSYKYTYLYSGVSLSLKRKNKSFTFSPFIFLPYCLCIHVFTQSQATKHFMRYSLFILYYVFLLLIDNYALRYHK